jgi:hypothetical protein
MDKSDLFVNNKKGIIYSIEYKISDDCLYIKVIRIMYKLKVNINKYSLDLKISLKEIKLNDNVKINIFKIFNNKSF